MTQEKVHIVFDDFTPRRGGEGNKMNNTQTQWMSDEKINFTRLKRS